MKITDCLPQQLNMLAGCMDKLQQIRLNANSPVKVKVDGANFYVGANGLQKGVVGALKISGEQIGAFIKKACQNSIYAFERQMSQGFLTLDDGCRIGVSGSGSICDDGQACFSSYSGVCIRINKAAWGCSSGIGDETIACSNILVAGLPGHGKTTFLRDIAARLSSRYDVVVLDERGELSRVDGFEARCCCDVLVGLERSRAVKIALQSLSPEVLICDEIFDSDLPWLKHALQSGVNVCASMHCRDFSGVNDFVSKNGLKFDKYVILEQFGGKMAKLYDKSANYITL